MQVVPYTLLLSVVEYKTLVLRGDMETAADVLETIPQASCAAGCRVGLCTHLAHGAPQTRSLPATGSTAPVCCGCKAAGPAQQHRQVPLCSPPAAGSSGSVLLIPCCCRTSTTTSQSFWRPRACWSRRCRWPQTQVRRLFSGYALASEGVFQTRCVSSRRLRAGMLLAGSLRAKPFCPSLTVSFSDSHNFRLQV